jgi:hypothetical protein
MMLVLVQPQQFVEIGTFFSFKKFKNVYFFYFLMQIKKCFEFDLLTLKCKLYDPFEKSVKDNCSTILQRVICLFFGT